MTLLPMFENTLIGRVLPRGQRYVDIADEAVREDPGFERAALNAWERAGADGDDSDPGTWDWDAFEDLVYEVMPEDLEVELAGDRWEPVPDVVVWVNGVPLEAWLAGDNGQTAPFVDLGQDLPEPTVVHGDNTSRIASLRLLRTLGDDDLGWGPSYRGRRTQSRMRWRHRAHHRSARVIVATRAVRAARLGEPASVQVDDGYWPYHWLDDGWHKHHMWAACRGCEALMWRMEREGGF